MTNPDQMLYFVLADFGAKLGHAWVERDTANMDRATTIADIATGQFDVVKVLECNPVEGICRDCTEDLLAEAFADAEMPEFDRQTARFDHARDLRKHSEAA